MRNRADILREGIEKIDKIIEIGASFSPLAPKREGWHCFTVDHADRDGLVEKYRHDSSANVAMIEPVDFVWTEGALSSAIPVEHHGTFDVFLASHVIEHIPDLVGFLQAAEVLVRADGRVVLAIPDKRVCFDFFRPLTTTGDLLVAHWERRARHMPKALWDYFAYQVTKHGAPGWGRSDQATPALTYTLEQALAWTRRHDSGAYIDAHSSTFVPASFALIMLELARLGLTDWEIERSQVAEYTEFYVWLRRGALANAGAMSQTDITTERTRLLSGIMSELDDQGRQLVSSRANRFEHDLACAMEVVAQHRQAEAGWVAKLEQAQLERTNAWETTETTGWSRASRAGARLRKLLGGPASLSDSGRNGSAAGKSMIPFQLHRRIPLLRRPFFQRDQAIRERDALSAQLTAALAKLERAAFRSVIRNDPVESAPSHQVALDLFKGAWLSAMPVDSGLSAGTVDTHFNDGRVTWVESYLGGLAGKSILELGPFEGYNTYQLDRLGAERVISIDNSPANFLKCLIIKNAFGLRATFLLGDFIKFLEAATERFDICWASGVLYHMTEPLRFLEAASRVSDTLVIWTHFFSRNDIVEDPNALKFFDSSKDQSIRWGNRDIALHYRSYLSSDADRESNLFAGGADEFSFWMELDDIKFVLGRLGYREIEMAAIDPRSPNGPACFFVASKRPPGAAPPSIATQAEISDSATLLSDSPLLRFERRLPSDQTAVDAFRGRWASDLEPLLGVTGTGTVPLFTRDRRPQQAATILGRDGKLSGFNVLELGPLEGAHSCLLEGLDVASVTAVESNVEAYLKCLVIKEVLGLKRCRFLLGDIVEYLAAATYRQFDLIFCSGVLYHMADPLTLIRLICTVTDRCFIWTHYYDEQQHPLPFQAQFHSDAGFAATYWSHTYGNRSSQFWGGNKKTAVWLEMNTLLEAFCHFGLADITVVQDERDHPNGPCITFTARRPG